MATTPDVFIIESLHPTDEGNGHFEGVMLSHVLRLHGKVPEYHYVRTRKQFEQAVVAFGDSNYRYLHISAHGNRAGLCTTNRDDIDYDDLGVMLRPHMEGKRLFVSSCEMVHKDLAASVISESGCYSVTGPTKKIYFSDSALVWASVYHLMFSENSAAMKQASLLKKLRQVSELFNVPLAHYGKAKSRAGCTDDLLSDDL